MNIMTLLAILSFSSYLAYCQDNILIFKKRNKVITRYWTVSTFAFQQWEKGEIIKIKNDSFYIRPIVVSYSFMGTDTLHYKFTGFAFTDIYALPNTGIQIDYINGHFQITRSGRHVHCYLIKSGWVFRAGTACYAGINILNGLITNNFSFSDSNAKFLSIKINKI